jgi:hypothetical protein
MAEEPEKIAKFRQLWNQVKDSPPLPAVLKEKWINYQLVLAVDGDRKMTASVSRVTSGESRPFRVPTRLHHPKALETLACVRCGSQNWPRTVKLPLGGYGRRIPTSTVLAFTSFPTNRVSVVAQRTMVGEYPTDLGMPAPEEIP